MSIGLGTSSAQTPLQRNFGGLKSYVAAYVQGADLTPVLTAAGVAINAAIDYLNMEKWGFLHKSGTITLNSTDSDYTTPADLKKPLKLFRVNADGNLDGIIRHKEHGVFYDELRTQLSNGYPGVYTIPSTAVRTLVLDRVPSADFVTAYPTLSLRYYARLMHFADDSNTIGNLNAPPEVWLFLGWYGRWDLASTKSQFSQSDRAFKHWSALRKRLKLDDLDTLTDYDL